MIRRIIAGLIRQACETLGARSKLQLRPPRIALGVLDLLRRERRPLHYNTILGIESKCTEHLCKHIPNFSMAYDDKIDDNDARRNSTWFRLMQKLRVDPRPVREPHPLFLTHKLVLNF